jgi:hypothetical protein
MRILLCGLVLVVVKALTEFFAEVHVRSNFLCYLGYGDRAKLFPRSPRLEFDEASLRGEARAWARCLSTP